MTEEDNLAIPSWNIQHCKHCGKTIDVGKRRKKFCSYLCYTRYHALRRYYSQRKNMVIDYNEVEARKKVDDSLLVNLPVLDLAVDDIAIKQIRDQHLGEGHDIKVVRFTCIAVMCDETDKKLHLLYRTKFRKYPNRRALMLQKFGGNIQQRTNNRIYKDQFEDEYDGF